MGKRANGEGTIIRLKNGKWKAIVSLGFDSLGKRIRPSRTHAKHADAVVALRELMETATLGIHAASAHTVGDCIDCWIRDVVAVRSAQSTVESYSRVANKHIKPHIGAVPLKSVTPLHVQKMLSSLAKAGKGTRSLQLAFVVLSNCMNNLVETGQLATNPCRPKLRPKYERGKIHPFDADEAKLILKQTNGTRHHAMVYLALSCGMRQGELLGLHWEQIDFDGKIISIDRQAIESSSANVTIARPKTRASIRNIPINDDTIKILKDHQKILKAEKNGASDLVFPTMTGAIRRKSDFINRVWRRVLAKAGIKPHRGFHHTRHTYATLALGAKVPVHVVSKILGHSSPSVTWNTYAHVLQQDQFEARDTMSKILGGYSVVARKS